MDVFTCFFGNSRFNVDMCCYNTVCSRSCIALFFNGVKFTFFTLVIVRRYYQKHGLEKRNAEGSWERMAFDRLEEWCISQNKIIDTNTEHCLAVSICWQVSALWCESSKIISVLYSFEAPVQFSLRELYSKSRKTFNNNWTNTLVNWEWRGKW